VKVSLIARYFTHEWLRHKPFSVIDFGDLKPPSLVKVSTSIFCLRSRTSDAQVFSLRTYLKRDLAHCPRRLAIGVGQEHLVQIRSISRLTTICAILALTIGTPKIRWPPDFLGMGTARTGGGT
jgi:hypothetical protein